MTTAATAPTRPAGALALIARAVGALELGMASVGTLWIFGLMFLICGDVTGRWR